MTKQVLLSTPAQKQFMDLNHEMKRRVKKALHRLAEFGYGDIRKLKGIKGREDLFRLRVGDYRIVYKDVTDGIYVIQIFHRGKGYEWL